MAIETHFDRCMKSFGPYIARMEAEKKSPMELCDMVDIETIEGQGDGFNVHGLLFEVIRQLAPRANFWFDAVQLHPAFQEVGRWMRGYVKRNIYNGHILRRESDAILEGEVRSHMVTAMQLFFHQHHGRRVYVPSLGLAERLQHTKLRGLRGRDLRMPYPSFYVAVPKRIDLPIWNVVSGRHTVEGIYVTESQLVLNPHGVGQPHNRTLQLLIIGHDKGYGGSDALRNKGVTNDALFTIGIPLADDEKLDDSIERMANRQQGTVADKRNHDAWRETLGWLLNLIVYATWPDCEMAEEWSDPAAKALWQRRERAPKGSKRDDLSKRLRAMDCSKHFVLGPTVKVLRRDTGVDVGERRAGTGARTATGFERWTMVPGFWRRHHVGAVPEGGSRKDTPVVVKHIEPHWRVTLDGALPQVDMNSNDVHVVR